MRYHPRHHSWAAHRFTVSQPLGAQPGQTRTFLYDSLSRLTSATNPESGTVTYTYDANGKPKTKTDSRNVTTIYVYDRLGRNIIVSYVTPAGSSAVTTPQVRRYYDNTAAGTNGRGRPYWTETVGVSATAFDAYDSAGRPKQYH